jgi:hypothetical protein
MSLKLSRKKALAIKSEVTQGTMAAAGAGDCITIQDVSFKIGKNTVDRDYKRANLDTLTSVVAECWAEIESTVELRNSSSIGYPELETLICACGYSQSLASGTSSLQLVSAAQLAGMLSPANSLTADVYLDGIKYGMLGGIGTFKGTLEAGKVPLVTFSLKGAYSGSQDITMITETGNLTTAAPIVQSIALIVGSYTPIAVTKLDFDSGTETAMLSDVNSVNAIYGFVLTGRKPTVTINPLVDTLANHDAIAAMLSGTEYAIIATIGSTAGNKVQLYWPTVQYTEVTHEDRSGILAYAISGKANGTGNNSFKIMLQ